MKRLFCGLVTLGLLMGGTGLAKADLLVASFFSGQVLRYDDTTGVFLGTFANADQPGPAGLTIGPDGNLDVGIAYSRDIVRHYDGQSGAFIDTFISRGLRGVSDITFGPDGNFYVVNFGDAGGPSYISRHNGATGAFIDNFVAPVWSSALQSRTFYPPAAQPWHASLNLLWVAMERGYFKSAGNDRALQHNLFASAVPLRLRRLRFVPQVRVAAIVPLSHNPVKIRPTLFRLKFLIALQHRSNEIDFSVTAMSTTG